MSKPIQVQRRPRILLVDDQRDVVHTLSKLLTPLNAECRFADDGETGLHRLRTEVFDLALIDLAMPPNNAGGLWLLRQLADHRIRTPTVVLSGEGGMDDVIEAQRIGAETYVQKHKAADELLDIVTEVLADAAKSQWQDATTRLPAPIAIPLIQSRLPDDDVHRLRDSIHCVESIFRFTSLMAAASHRDRLAEHLKRPPSMGTWRSFCEALQDEVTTTALRRWLAAITDPTTSELVAVRNQFHHGAATPTPVWAREKQRDFDDWLTRFVTVATTHPAPRTVVAGKLEYTGNDCIVDVADLAGPATAVPWGHLRVPDPLQAHHVHLVVDNEPPIDLWPLILGDPADRPGHWNVSVLDSVTNKGRLRYLDLTPGTRVESKTTVANLTATAHVANP